MWFCDYILLIFLTLPQRYNHVVKKIELYLCILELYLKSAVCTDRPLISETERIQSRIPIIISAPGRPRNLRIDETPRFEVQRLRLVRTDAAYEV